MICSPMLSTSYWLSIHRQSNGRVRFETSYSVLDAQRLEKENWWHYLRSERWLQQLRVEMVMDEFQIIARISRLTRERLVALYDQGFPLQCGEFYTDHRRCSVSDFVALVESLSRLQQDPNFEHCWLSYEQMKALIKFVKPAHEHFLVFSKIR